MAVGGVGRREGSTMEVEREKWGRGRSWRIRTKRSREKGCGVRRRKRHFTSRRDKEKHRQGGLSRRKKMEATEEPAGELQPEDEKERAGTDEQGKGERREPEPESLEGQGGPKQREPGAGDLPGPEGEGPRAATPEKEKQEDAEQEEGEGEQPSGSEGAAEQQEDQTVARPDGQEEDRVAAELSSAKAGQTASAKPGSPLDGQGERGEELGVPEGQQEQRRAEGLEPLEEVKPGEAVQSLKKEEVEEERAEGGFSECQEGAGDIDERTTEDPGEIEMRQSGSGKFNSKILMNHDGGIVQEQVIPDIKGAGVD